MPLAPPVNFTFAIITNWDDRQRVYDILDNINHRAGLRPLDIIVIGGSDPFTIDAARRTRFVPAAAEWITTKKNTAAWLAKYNNIVFMHDYFLLEPYWFEGYEEFGDDHWDICSNPQALMNGERHFTDWVVWDGPLPRYTSLDYWDWSQTRNQYISGGYFVAKRKVLIDEPFNSNMGPGMPEDVEWSLRVRAKYRIKCNPYSKVIHNKVHRDMKV